MKKLFLILSVLFIQKMNAQISLEITHPFAYNNNTTSMFGLDYYSYLGYKYYYWDNPANTITIYDLNHAINRVITIPQQSSSYVVCYLTTQLFDTDSTDFEYIVEYNPPNGTTAITVYDENGTVLMHQDSSFLWQSNFCFPTANSVKPIVNTTSGTKMMLTSVDQNSTKIFSLPGILPCPPCGNFAGPIPNSTGDNNHPMQQGLSQPYPNPSNGSVQISYELPQGETSGEIVFYDVTGQEVKRYKVDNNFHDIFLSNADLAAGTYYYQLQTKNNISASRKMVVIQ